MDSQKTALFEEHLNLGAKIVDFAGWQMPIQYKNLKEEVLSVRNEVGVFDVSHMGEFFVEGAEAIKFVNTLVTNDIASAQMHKAIYSPLCRDNGTIIDDLIVYLLSNERVMICVNASNIEKDFNWIKSKLIDFDCTLFDKSSEYSLLAIQGPKTVEMIKQLDLGFEYKEIDYYSIQFDDAKAANPIILARTGYTGEDGFEIFGSHDYIRKTWSKLMELGAAPCGLGSRDVLRLEVCYPLYGHELNDEVTPLDAGLKWTVKMNKDTFVGQKALSEYTPKYRLIKLIMDKGIPREGYPVQDDEGQTIGIVTSGTMSVVLGKGIAIARVEKELYKAQEHLQIEIRGRKFPAHITKKAFVTGGHK